MKNLVVFLLICLLASSCQKLKIANDQKSTLADLAIDWSISDKVNNIYRNQIDLTMDSVINKFNSKKHSFIVHKKTNEDKDYLAFSFDKGKFVSDGGLATGYIISGLGLIASPIIILSASEGQAFLAFYYFPADRLQIVATLPPTLAANGGSRQNIDVKSGALLTSKSKRVSKINSKLYNNMYNLLYALNKQLLRK